jgi:hypothetical protein
MLFRTLSGLHPATASLLVFSSGLAIVNGLRFGQMYIVLALLMLLTLHWIRQGKEVSAGLAAGVLVPVKYFPLVLVLWFLLERRWRAAGAAVLAAAAVTALTVAVTGPGMFAEFFSSVLPEHLRSRYALQSPYASAFQSWDSLLMRLFVRDPAENPGAITHSPLLYRTTSGTILVAGLLLTGLAALRASRSPSLREIVPGLLGTGALLFAPGTATYHFILLLPTIVPVILQGQTTAPWHSAPPASPGTPQRAVLPGALRPALPSLPLRPATPAGMVLVLYAAIGWIPYGWFRTFESSGGIGVVLAYPRLFLVLAFYSLLLALVHRNGRGEEPPGVSP